MRPTPAGERWPYIFIPLIAALLLGIFPIPRDGSISAAVGRLARLRGDNGAAAVAFEKAANLLPGQPQFWEEAGLAAFDAGLYAKAASLLASAREHASLSPIGAWKLGDAYRMDGQPDLALPVWEEAASGGAGGFAVYQSLADGYIVKGDLENAAKALSGWQTQQPENAIPAYRLGLVLAVTDPDKSHVEFRRAQQLDPEQVAEITRIEAGIATAFLEEDPAYRLTVTGQALGSVGEWQLADSAFDRAIRLRPDYSEAWALLGEARQHLGQDGGEEIRKALSLDPSSFLSLSLAALRCQRRQEWQQAINYLDPIAHRDPSNPRWQIEMGNAYAGLGKLASAYESYSKAADMTPEDAGVWRQIAAFSLGANYDVESVGFSAARRAVQLEPNDAASLDLLGQVYMIGGDLVSAERILIRAADADPNYAMALLHLGIVQKDLGNIPAASQALLRAIELSPEGQVGNQARRLLDEINLVPSSGG